LGSLFAGAAPSFSAEENKFVETGGEVLRERMQIPWYDAQKDALRPIKISTRPAIDLSWLGEPILVMVVAVVAALLAFLTVLIVRVIRQLRGDRAPPRRQRDDPLVTADRVEALPFLRERPLGDLLALARQHYEQGNYSEAIIYLFSYQLVELDRSTVIRLARGKTNRQYLREAGRLQPVKRLLERTMITFEEVFFGRRALDRSGFESCWNEMGQFENLLSQAQATA
jgi:hypothetical protein